MFAVIIFIMISCIGINWFHSHFVLFDRSTMESQLFILTMSVIISFYLWEITISRKYASINTFVIIHHWLTVLFGGLLQIGTFLPYVTLYAYIGVGLSAPVGFI